MIARAINSSYKLQHFNERPQDVVVDTIVIHSVYAPGLRWLQQSPARCVNKFDKHEVSAHYMISRKGDVYKLVDEAKRAWHAGVSRMPDTEDIRENVNDFSIGIEMIVPEQKCFTSEQYKILAYLIADICKRHPIKTVLGHDHIAQPLGRKTDPGQACSWQELASAMTGEGLTAKYSEFGGLTIMTP